MTESIVEMIGGPQDGATGPVPNDATEFFFAIIPDKEAVVKQIFDTLKNPGTPFPVKLAIYQRDPERPNRFVFKCYKKR